MSKHVILLGLAIVFCFSISSCMALTAIGLETDSVGRKWEGHSFFGRMEKLTGVHVEGKAYDDRKAWKDRINGLQKEDADILLKADLTRTEERALLDSGVLIDIAPYLESCMPNLCALLQDNPEWKAQIALEDGRIASLPEINRESRQVIVWINARWLSNLGLAFPQNPEELGEVLEAFQCGDPDGNGKQDEKACDMVGMWELRWLLPYFGVSSDDWLIERDEEGKPCFLPESRAYRTFVETMADWYKRGIINTETFTVSHAGRAYLTDTGKANIGMFVSVSPVTHIPAENVTDYTALLMPCEGKITWRRFPGEIWNGCFAVTSSCKSPEEALRWADALYAEDAAILSLAGEEGIDWAWGDDGYWHFLADSNRTIEEIRRSSVMNTGTKMPGLFPSPFAARVSSQEDRWIAKEYGRVRAAASAEQYDAALSSVDRSEAESLIKIVGRLTDERTAEFITGNLDLNDENWSNWLLELESCGSGRLTGLFVNRKDAE